MSVTNWRLSPRTIIPILVFALLVTPIVGCGHSKGPIPSASSHPNMTVRFLDVGQGDACIIRWKTEGKDRYALVDAGPPDKASKVVDELKQEGCSELTVFVTTHPHADHVGGATAVLDNFKVDEIWEPGSDNPGASSWTSFENDARAKGTREVNVYAGITARWGETRVRVLNPFQGKADKEGNLNNTSVVLLLSLGKTDVLLCGDAESAVQENMLSESISDVEIMKASHHGSSNGVNPAFLDKVTPDESIISVGPNDYGHPNQSAITALSGKGQVWRTDTMGDIEIDMSRNGYWVIPEKGTKSPERISM